MPLRESIKKDFEHIVWLIKNSHWFGAARPAEEAQAAIGTLVSTAYYAEDPESKRSFKRRLIDLTAAVALFTALIQGGQAAIEATVEFSDSLPQMAQIFDDDSEPAAPKEIEAKQTEHNADTD